jgi:hypothetical protein
VKYKDLMNPFAKRLLILLGCFGCLTAGVVGLTALAKYKPYGVPELLIPKWEAMQAEIAAAEALKKQSAELQESSSPAVADLPHPKAVVDETEFDFGMLDPGGSAAHTFVIRNEGSAPLVLAAGDTSCKCTLSEVSKQLVAVGESAEVTLTWNTGTKREFYRQYAVIRTNDPNQREIELAVSGQVRALLAFDQDELLAPAVEPGEGAKVETIIYSQFLTDFDVKDVTCGLPGFLHIAEPLADDELEKLKATFGLRLRFSTDASMSRGNFKDLIRMSVVSDELPTDQNPMPMEIAVSGRVTAPITFYGADLHAERGLEMGLVSDGKEKVMHLLVKFRGDRIPEAMIVSRVEPEIIETEVEPIESRPGTFKLTIRIPAGAPQTIFNRESQHGYVEVCDKDNPHVKNWFPVYGAVIKI